MAFNAAADNPYFRDLVCAYTDRPLTVRVAAAGGRPPVFFSPDAFDPGERCKDLEDLIDRLGTRRGIIGALSGPAALVCPYTGARMSVKKDTLGFYAEGGFHPRHAVPDPAELARGLMMRGGRLPEGAPQLRARVTARSLEEAEAPLKDTSDAPTDEALEVASRVHAETAPKKVSVTVPGKAGKK